MISIASIFIFLAIGLCAGFMGGLLGIGGGFIVVPALLWTFHFLDFPLTYGMQIAAGTSLAAMIFTAASSAWTHYQHTGIFWPIVRPLVPGIVGGSIAGALIAFFLPSKQLAFLFGIFISLAGLFLTFQPEQLHEKERALPKPWIIHWIGISIGTISSAFGIGGGIITVPLLTALGTPMRNAVSTSALTGFFIALIGSMMYLLLGLLRPPQEESVGYLYIPAFVAIALVSPAAAWAGAKCAHSMPTRVLKKIFGIFMFVAGILIFSQI